MTLYRDDIQETIAYSNNTIGKSEAITEELIKIKEDSFYRLSVLSGDVVLVKDELVDSAIFPVKDEIKIIDHFTGRKRHVDFIHDQIIVSDGFKIAYAPSHWFTMRLARLLHQQTNKEVLVLNDCSLLKI